MVKKTNPNNLIRAIAVNVLEVLAAVIKRRLVYYLIKIPGYIGVFAPWFMILAIPLKDLPYVEGILNFLFKAILILSGRIHDETIGFLTIAMAGINAMFIVGLIAEVYERITHREATITADKNLEFRKYTMISGWVAFAIIVAVQQREPRLLVLMLPVLIFYPVYKFEKNLLVFMNFKKQR